MTAKKTRKTYTAEFKAEALKPAERVGIAEEPRQLKIYKSELYNWRTATEIKSTTIQPEAEVAAEVAKLKRQLADQAEDLAILKQAPTSRRIENKPIQIHARTPAPVSPKANGDGPLRDAKWVLCLAKIKQRTECALAQKAPPR